MGGVIDLIVKQGFLFPIQIIIIIINAYLFYSKKTNIYIDISSLLILSTLVLQALRRRFVLIHPTNFFVNRESSGIDTYYLRVVIVLSTFSALLGLLLAYHERLESYLKFGVNQEGQEYIFSMVVIGIIFICIIPCLFWFLGARLNDRIANKLRKLGPYTYIDLCPRCKRPIVVKHEIIHKNEGQVNYCCSNPECNYVVGERVSLNIGE